MKIQYLSLILLTAIVYRCNVNTGTINLDEEVFLDNIKGHYQLTAAGSAYLNDTSIFFATAPSPTFSISSGFIINSKGTININNNNNTANLLIDFLSTMPTSSISGIFKIIAPSGVAAGSKTSQHRFMKIDIDTKNGNLSASTTFADSEINAQSLSTSVIFASLI